MFEYYITTFSIKKKKTSEKILNQKSFICTVTEES